MARNKAYLRLHLRIFWSVAAFFTVLTAGAIIFQFSHEKQYKMELLNDQLTDHNNYIYYLLKEGYNLDSVDRNSPFRTTVLNLSGEVSFDSELKTNYKIANHSDRSEIQMALKQGIGYAVRRKSETTHEVYFYSAKRYENVIIRSALPYKNHLMTNFSVDMQFIHLSILLVIILGIAFFIVMQHLGESIKHLNELATKAERDEIIEYPTHFPNNELGDISRHLVQIYNRLMNMKKDLLQEQQQVIAQKEEKDIIKRQLTQNIAHELKTPVSSIQGYLETIISNKHLDREIIDDFIAKSYEQSTRLAALLYDISNLTRIDEAPELIKKEPTDIGKIIKQVISDVSLQLKDKNSIVINNTADRPFPCYGNVSLLYSIFRNLLDNSIAYAGTNIIIEIECYKEAPTVYYFSCSDTGVGIEEKHLPRIFERFYRVDKGRSRTAGGTGLGLSVVKHAILFHNGDIIAKAREGGGITFLFSIGK
jgi:signal transduction histidine kinase